MSSTSAAPRRRGFTGLLWGLAILAGTLVPAGGLVVAVGAAFTTYRTAPLGTRVALVTIGVLTVLLQLSTLFVVGHDGGVGHPVRVR